jgi:hypothetical protein
MRCHVALVRPDVSEVRITSIIRLTRIGELKTLAVTCNRKTLRRNAILYAIILVLLRSVLRLLITVNVAPSSPFLVTLMMEATLSSEMSVLTKTTWRYIPEDCNPHSYRRKTLEAYTEQETITNITISKGV